MLVPAGMCSRALLASSGACGALGLSLRSGFQVRLGCHVSSCASCAPQRTLLSTVRGWAGHNLLPVCAVVRPPAHNAGFVPRHQLAGLELCHHRLNPKHSTLHLQGMSYANLAGVPSVYGLYGGFIPLMVYAAFGSCRQLGVGPVAVTSLLISSGMISIVPGADLIADPNNPEGLAPIQEQVNLKVIQLAFLVACLYTGAGRHEGQTRRFGSHEYLPRSGPVSRGTLHQPGPDCAQARSGELGGPQHLQLLLRAPSGGWPASV
jgi:hypothetical protein